MEPMAAPATHDQRRLPPAPYIVGAAVGVALHWLAALALWLAAHAIAMNQCQHNAYGLAVPGGGVSTTEAGCVVDVPTTTSGSVAPLLPTLDSGFAAAAAIVAALGALWPLLLFIAYHRKVSRHP